MIDLHDRLLEGAPMNLRAKAVAKGILKDPQVRNLLEPLPPEDRHQVLRQVVTLDVPILAAVKTVESNDTEEGNLPSEAQDEENLRIPEYLDTQGGEDVGIPENLDTQGGEDTGTPEVLDTETPDDAPDDDDHKVSDKNPNRLVTRVRCDSLTPNPFNKTLFEESLSDDSIQRLADTMDYQRVPIEVTDTGVIVDGERRWRAAKLLGWEMVDVVQLGKLSDQEIRDRVLDAYTSTRDASLAEKFRLYLALKEQLERRYGRAAPGRPKKQKPNGISFESPNIEEIAAKKAGLRSLKTAQRLTAVMDRASPDVRKQVLTGTVSISKAYEGLPKRPKASSKKSEETSSYDDAEDQLAKPDLDPDEDEQATPLSEEEAPSSDDQVEPEPDSDDEDNADQGDDIDDVAVEEPSSEADDREPDVLPGDMKSDVPKVTEAEKDKALDRLGASGQLSRNPFTDDRNEIEAAIEENLRLMAENRELEERLNKVAEALGCEPDAVEAECSELKEALGTQTELLADIGEALGCDPDGAVEAIEDLKAMAASDEEAAEEPVEEEEEALDNDDDDLWTPSTPEKNESDDDDLDYLDLL